MSTDDDLAQAPVAEPGLPFVTGYFEGALPGPGPDGYEGQARWFLQCLAQAGLAIVDGDLAQPPCTHLTVLNLDTEDTVVILQMKHVTPALAERMRAVGEPMPPRLKWVVTEDSVRISVVKGGVGV